MHVAQTFERLLDAYRRPDGRRWTGQQLDEATGGIVARSYFTNLRKGRIENPGYEKLRAIAKAMGFRPEEWFEESVGDGSRAAPTEDQDLASRVEHLFGVIRNRATEKPYTYAEVARMTLGDLSGEDVEGIRTGAIGDPTVGQVAALAGVFGVESSYLLDRGEPVFDGELVEALRDEAVREATREISRLSEGEASGVGDRASVPGPAGPERLELAVRDKGRIGRGRGRRKGVPEPSGLLQVVSLDGSIVTADSSRVRWRRRRRRGRGLSIGAVSQIRGC